VGRVTLRLPAPVLRVGHRGRDAQILTHADDVVCSPFGGEGTGRSALPPGASAPLPVRGRRRAGSALTLHMTDLTVGRRRFGATFRYAARADLSWLGTFVEGFLRDATDLPRPGGPQRSDLAGDGPDRRLRALAYLCGYICTAIHTMPATPGRLPAPTLRSTIMH